MKPPRQGFLARWARNGALALNAAMVAGILATAFLLGATTGADDVPRASVATVRAEPIGDPFDGFVPPDGATQ